MPLLNRGSGEALEEQVGGEIQLCPSLETIVCSMEAWGQEEVGGRTHVWYLPFAGGLLSLPAQSFIERIL